MIGTTIGKYKIVKKVGHGGMGAVYRAIDETLDREVAIKVLNPDLVDEDALKRFRAEAVTLAKLHHPRIATVYELTREHDVLLMVMEFVTGETFEQLVNRIGPLPIDRALTLCCRALEALQYAHHAGVIHRDLKPVNLMVTPSDDVKVTGFGIARVMGTEHMTTDGAMMGTPAYMAPEQIRGEEIDERADLYAMAVVLYRLLTGRLPFKADTAVAMIHAQIYDLPTPLRELRADVPEWLDAALTRALAKAPADRFQMAEEFRSTLERGLGGVIVTASRPASDRPDDVSRTVPPTVSTAAPPVPTGPPPARVAPTAGAAAGGSTVILRKQHLIVAGGLLLLLGIGVGALAFVAFTGNATPPPTAPGSVATETTVPTSAPAVAAPDAAAPTPTPAAVAPAVPPPPPATRVARGTAAASRTPPPATPVARDTAPPAASAPAPSSPEPPKAAAGKATSPVESAPLSFDDVKALVPDGSKAKERDATLSFEPGTLVVRSKDGDESIKALPYRAIVSATYSESKRPRWNDAADVAAVPAEFGGRGFLLQRSRNWLTLQSRTDFVIVRLERDAVAAVLRAVEARTGLTVQKPAPDE